MRLLNGTEKKIVAGGTWIDNVYEALRDYFDKLTEAEREKQSQENGG